MNDIGKYGREQPDTLTTGLVTVPVLSAVDLLGDLITERQFDFLPVYL